MDKTVKATWTLGLLWRCFGRTSSSKTLGLLWSCLDAADMESQLYSSKATTPLKSLRQCKVAQYTSARCNVAQYITSALVHGGLKPKIYPDAGGLGPLRAVAEHRKSFSPKFVVLTFRRVPVGTPVVALVMRMMITVKVQLRANMGIERF